MYHLAATVIAKLEVMPGIWELHLRVPEIARAAQPGQFLMMLRSAAYDPYLRVPVSLLRIKEDSVALLLDQASPAQGPLAQRGVGQEVDSLGPLGKGFKVPPVRQHLLLIGQGLSISPLVALAEWAVAQGKQATLLAIADSPERLYPAELLPRAIEYHSVIQIGDNFGSCRDLLGQMLPWADQVFVAGTELLYRFIHQQVSIIGSARRRKSYIQAWIASDIVCGMGVCWSCAHQTHHGMRRICTDGPVFDLYDLL